MALSPLRRKQGRKEVWAKAGYFSRSWSICRSFLPLSPRRLHAKQRALCMAVFLDRTMLTPSKGPPPGRIVSFPPVLGITTSP